MREYRENATEFKGGAGISDSRGRLGVIVVADFRRGYSRAANSPPIDEDPLKRKRTTLLLAGDIGGTKTDLALYSPTDGPRRPREPQEYPSAKYDSLEDVVRDYFRDTGTRAEGACFDVAGPVVNGKAKLTNLKWRVEAARLKRALGLKQVWLLNDLQATANAVPILGARDRVLLNKGQRQPGGAIGVVAPGTGLGEAYLTWDGSQYHAFASEGGHTEFGPNGPDQTQVLSFLQKRFGHVSYERVCSGMGIPNLYDALEAGGRHRPTPAVQKKLAAAEDRTPVIVAAAQEASPCPLCRATLELFVAILGAEAGNLALKLLATGGIFLGGGIPPRILPILKRGGFIKAFIDKGRLSDFVRSVPVYVIVRQAALIGAARYGLDRI